MLHWRRWLGPALIAGAALAMLWWSAGSWPDPIVDFGRELYVPWQLAQGKTLYRDVAYQNGPLSPYWNRLWFGALGVSLRTLVVANLAAMAALLALLYRLLREMAGALAATLGGLAFVFLFGFAQLIPIGNYNWVCPYSHEMTHGILLCLAALYALWRSRTGPRGRLWAAVAGIALGLAFLTKVEVFVAGAAAVAALLGGGLLAGRDAARRTVLPLGCGFLAPPLLAFGLLLLALPARAALLGTLGSWAHLSQPEAAGQLFYLAGAGLIDPAHSLRQIAGWTAIYLLLLGPPAVLALASRKPGGWRVAAGALAALFTAVVLFAGLRALDWGAFASPLPLAAACVALLTLAALFAARNERALFERLLLRFAFAVFAFGLLLKILLHARIWHYGFGLAMPATLLAVTALVDLLPRRFDRAGGSGRVFLAAALVFTTAVVAIHLLRMDGFLRAKTVTVGAGADAFRADARGAVLDESLAQLASLLPPGATLTALPDGEMLNFLARRRNPVPYGNFVPHQVAVFGEDEMLAALRRTPPDAIAIVHKDTSEYGARFFGRDYARRLSAWIDESYAPLALAGAPPLTDRRFGILILARKAAAGPAGRGD